ncbi:MAG: hypothetical protein OHK0056_12930 [Bacteriovoracaceae bacterium]
MKTYFLLIIFSLLSLNSFAQEEDSSDKRRSSLGYNIDLGKDGYKNHSLSAVLGLTETWAIGLGGTKSTDDTTNEYTSGYIYASAYWNDIFSNKLTLKSNKEQPQELLGRGFDLQTQATYPVFSEDLYSTLSFTFGQTVYQQTIINNGVFGTTKSEIEFTQKNYTISYEQDLISFLSIGISHTGYSYEDQSRATFTGKNGKLSVSGSLDSTSDSPESKNSLWTTFSFEKFEIELSASKTKTKVTNGDYQTAGLYFSYFVNDDWTLSAGVDQTKYDSDNSKTDIVNFGVNFSF